MTLIVHPILASVQVFVESHPMSSPSSLRVIVVSNHYCHMASKNIAMHHRLNCEGDCSQFHQPNRASTSADRISQAASSKVKKKGSAHHVTIYIRMRHRSKCQRPISGRASAYDEMNQALRRKEKGLVFHAIDIRHPIHYIAKLTYHEEGSSHAQPIYVEEFITSSSFPLDPPKRIQYATEFSSLQEQHRK